jgi:hypothetical protein
LQIENCKLAVRSEYEKLCNSKTIVMPRRLASRWTAMETGSPPYVTIKATVRIGCTISEAAWRLNKIVLTDFFAGMTTEMNADAINIHTLC